MTRRKFLSRFLAFFSIAPLVALFPSLAKAKGTITDVKTWVGEARYTRDFTQPTESWPVEGEDYLCLSDSADWQFTASPFTIDSISFGNGKKWEPLP